MTNEQRIPTIKNDPPTVVKSMEPNLTVEIDTITKDIRQQISDLYTKIGYITRYFDVSVSIAESTTCEESGSFLRNHHNGLSDISNDLGILLTQLSSVENQMS